MADQKFKPQPSPGYVGMLSVTAASMVIGIVCLAIEANEYGWDPKPKPTDKIALPTGSVVMNLEPMFPRDTATVQTPPTVKPEKVEPKVAEKPAPTPVVPNLPAPPAVVATPQEPKDTPKGPVPSPLAFPKPDATKPVAAPKDPPTSDEMKPAPSPLRLGQPKG